MIGIIRSDIWYLIDTYFLPGLIIGLFSAVIIKPLVHLVLARFHKNGNLENIISILVTIGLVLVVTTVAEIDLSTSNVIIKNPAVKFIEVSIGVSAIAVLIVNNWPLISNTIWKIFKPKERHNERNNEPLD